MKRPAKWAILIHMEKVFVHMSVHSVSVDSGDALPLVILHEGGGDGALAIPVGPFEASAILLELEGISPPRPLTHDLLADLFRETGLALERAELFGEIGEGARARLIYRRGFSRREKEVRPSDALALALRLKAPICAARELLSRRGMPSWSVSETAVGKETQSPFHLDASISRG
jgi:hypothetical protein